MESIRASEIKNIVVIHLDASSEVILATPVVRMLRKVYSGAQIVLLTVPDSALMAQMNPYADRVLLYDKRGEHRGLSGFVGIVAALRKERFDLAVCLNLSVRGALVAWSAGIRWRVGFDAQLARLFLTHPAPVGSRAGCRRAAQYLAVLQPLKLSTKNTSLVLAIAPDVEKLVQSTLQLEADKPIVAVCPVNALYPRKGLSVAKSVAIVSALKEHASVYLLGRFAEQPALQRISSESGLDPTHVFAGSMNLQEIAVFLQQAAVLLAIDCGILQMAQALKLPSVALFGPTDPAVYGPSGNKDIALAAPKPCAPCKKHQTCAQSQCIDAIPTEEIVAKVLARLKI